MHLPALLARHWRGLAELAAGWAAIALTLGTLLGHAIRAHNPIDERDGELVTVYESAYGPAYGQ